MDARKYYEEKFGRKISDFLWNVLITMDGFYTPLEPLREECRKRKLTVSGDKKTLIYRLLVDEIKS